MRHLRACMATNLKFAWRNRLPLAIGGLLLLVFVLTLMPAMLFSSSTKRLELLRHVVLDVTSFAYCFTIAVGLLTLSHHLRARCAKLVLTKPCRLEIWVAANFLSPLVLAVLLYAVALVIGLGLCSLWQLPVQAGLCYTILANFFNAVIMSAYLILLTALFHPVVAVLIALFFQEWLFRWIAIWSAAWVQEGGASTTWVATLVQWVATAIYHLLPSYGPFGTVIEKVGANFRVEAAAFQPLLLRGLYALSISVFCFLLAYAALRRKRLT